MTQPSPLAESQSWCREVCQQSGSSFYPAFRLLTRPRKLAMEALYAFSRITDDLSDSTADETSNANALGLWAQDTERQLLNPTQTDNSPRCELLLPKYSALWPSLTDAVNRYSIPQKLLTDLIAGCHSDQDFVQPSSWDETLRYCYQVASTVGIACTYIWKSDTLADEEAALKCGYAFQLTNILRDIAEDAANGRIYLPQSDFEKFDIATDSWLAGSPDRGWLAMIDECIARARGYYQEGQEISNQLAPDGKRMFRLMWQSYHQLLDNVDSNKATLWNGPKVRLTRLQKLKLASRTLLRA